MRFNFFYVGIILIGLLIFMGCGKTQSTVAIEDRPDAGASSYSFPFSDKPITLKMTRAHFSGIRDSAAKTWMWQDYAKKTNITIDWLEGVPDEQMRIMLTTGKGLPDAFYQAFNVNLVEQAAAKNIIPLDDLITKYAPNVRKMFEQYPDVKKAITLPDGHIYSLPYVELNVIMADLRLWINNKMVQEAGVKFPETIAELDTFMRAIKKKHPEIYPMSLPYNGQILIQGMMGAWGLGKLGLQGINAEIDLGDDGKLMLLRTSDRFREYLTQLRTWYKDGLIHPEMFTTLTIPQWIDLGKKGQVGVFGWVNEKYVGEPASKDFLGVPQLTGPHGDKLQSWVDPLVRGVNAFAISRVNQHPIETMKWVDWFFSPEGTRYASIGEEGKTYNFDAQGNPQWSSDIQDAINKLGGQVGPFQFLERWYGGYEPQINALRLANDRDQKAYDTLYMMSIGVAGKMPLKNPNEDPEKYLPKVRVPNFIGTKEEVDQLAELADLFPYLNKAQTEFIIGKLDIDKDWANYLATVEKLGGAKYLAIKQKQYERFLGSK